jgi:RNA polymerase sigma-70 factor (ECF subfamily)
MLRRDPSILHVRTRSTTRRDGQVDGTATTSMGLLPERGTIVTPAGSDPVADHDLVRRLWSGDEGAFRELFARYGPVAHGLAYRLVRHAQLAEEIVQETFLSVWRSPERYDRSMGSVRSWLLAAVHHRAVDAVRREESQRRRADRAAGRLELVTDDPTDELAAAIDRPQEQKLVREALEALPDEQRDVLSKMYFEGLTQTQIAERTGVPLGTVKSRTLLGMRRLRALLGDLGR